MATRAARNDDLDPVLESAELELTSGGRTKVNGPPWRGGGVAAVAERLRLQVAREGAGILQLDCVRRLWNGRLPRFLAVYCSTENTKRK